MRKFFLIVVTLSLLVFFGCKDNNHPLPIPTVPPKKVPTLNMKPLRIFYIPGGSNTYMIEKWQKLADYLTDTTGIPVEAEIAQTYKTFADSFMKKHADIGFLGGLMYVRLKKEIDVIPIVCPLENDKAYYKSFIIVKEESGIKDFKGLKGKSFSFVDKKSTTGYLFPRLMMFESGIKEPNKYFSRVEYTQDHLSTIISVYNGYFDGGAVSEYIFTSEEAKRYKGLKIIMESEKIPLGCFAVRKDLDPECVKKLKEAFLQIGKSSDTYELAKILRVTGYVEAKDSDYDTIRKAINKLDSMGEDIFEENEK